ncbi:pectin lyase fold/virulence factor [Chytriomyces cf. hyalinus JEL632]|nr:pectin lyase fold/virulence factor [Chytriomyces cf. hyalinus JEL632]
MYYKKKCDPKATVSSASLAPVSVTKYAPPSVATSAPPAPASVSKYVPPVVSSSSSGPPAPVSVTKFEPSVPASSASSIPPAPVSVSSASAVPTYVAPSPAPISSVAPSPAPSSNVAPSSSASKATQEPSPVPSSVEPTSDVSPTSSVEPTSADSTTKNDAAPSPTAVALPPGKVCNMLTYAGESKLADYGPAIWKAYTDCIQTKKGNVLLIPEGTYDVNMFGQFTRASDWTFQLDGNLNLLFAPDRNAGTLLQWNRASNVVLQGKGTIFGNGGIWRPNGDLGKYTRPRLVRFQDCTNIRVYGINLINAPMFHLTLDRCNDSIIDGVTIKADHIGTTDGIDIAGNNNIVRNVSVENGDECVTVKTPTNGVLIENITCVYTGGCQMGSFAANGHAEVQNVHYRNVTLIGSQTAAYVKAYPGTTGYIKDVLYEDFHMQDTAYVVGIDSHWCHGPCGPETGNLAVSNVTYRNFWGTQASNSARPLVKLDCLQAGGGCSNINFEEFTVKSGRGTANYIKNACGVGSIPHGGLGAC